MSPFVLIGGGLGALIGGLWFARVNARDGRDIDDLVTAVWAGWVLVVMGIAVAAA